MRITESSGCDRGNVCKERVSAGGQGQRQSPLDNWRHGPSERSHSSEHAMDRHGTRGHPPTRRRAESLPGQHVMRQWAVCVCGGDRAEESSWRHAMGGGVRAQQTPRLFGFWGGRGGGGKAASGVRREQGSVSSLALLVYVPRRNRAATGGPTGSATSRTR